MQETVETERLILRKPVVDDRKEIFESYATDSDVVRYLAWEPHLSMDVTKSFIEERVHEWSDQKRFSWVISTKPNEQVIGMISVKFLSDFRASISYVINQKNWGKGYATEAAKAIISKLLELDFVYRVEALCDIKNFGSEKVLKKLGMTFEGRMNRTGYTPNISSEPRDCFCFSITK